MTNEKLARRIRNGEKELMPQLWEQVEKFVKLKAGRYYRRDKALSNNGFKHLCYEYGELVQEGYIAVYNACKYYKRDEVPYLYYLSLALKSAFYEVSLGIFGHKRRDPLIKAMSLNISVGEDESAQLIDFIFDEKTEAKNSIEEKVTEGIYQQQLHDALESSIALLSEMQRQVIRKRFYDSATLDQAASQLGISRDKVRRTEIAALQQMYDNRVRFSLDEYVEDRTSYYKKQPLQTFKDTMTSIVEEAVIEREKYRKDWLRKNKAKWLKYCELGRGGASFEH